MGLVSFTLLKRVLYFILFFRQDLLFFMGIYVFCFCIYCSFFFCIFGWNKSNAIFCLTILVTCQTQYNLLYQMLFGQKHTSNFMYIYKSNRVISLIQLEDQFYKKNQLHNTNTIKHMVILAT